MGSSIKGIEMTQERCHVAHSVPTPCHDGHATCVPLPCSGRVRSPLKCTIFAEFH